MLCQNSSANFFLLRSQLVFVPRFWSKRRECPRLESRIFRATVACSTDCFIASWESVFLFGTPNEWNIIRFIPSALTLWSAASPRWLFKAYYCSFFLHFSFWYETQCDSSEWRMKPGSGALKFGTSRIVADACLIPFFAHSDWKENVHWNPRMLSFYPV